MDFEKNFVGINLILGPRQSGKSYLLEGISRWICNKLILEMDDNKNIFNSLKEVFYHFSRNNFYVFMVLENYSLIPANIRMMIDRIIFTDWRVMNQYLIKHEEHITKIEEYSALLELMKVKNFRVMVDFRKHDLMIIPYNSLSLIYYCEYSAEDKT